jgi:hypothetical protein
MNNQEIAEKLNNVEYGKEDCAINSLIGNKNTVVVYPYSDDGIEFLGAIRDELSAYDGTTVFLNANGIIKKSCDSEDCPHEKHIFDNAPFFIKQLWCKREGYSWTYETNIPNAAKFVIVEDGEIFGEGLVFSLHDLSV